MSHVCPFALVFRPIYRQSISTDNTISCNLAPLVVFFRSQGQYTMLLRVLYILGCSYHTASTFFKEVLQPTWSSDPLDGSPNDHHHMKKTNVRRRQQDGHASWQRGQKSSQREHCWTWLKLNQREQQAFCLRPTLLLEVVKGGLSN